MNPEHKGALPSQKLADLMEAGCIKGADPENVSPASLDMSVSSEMYEITGLLLPKRGEKIKDLLPLMGATTHDITTPLLCDRMYLVRLNETLALPENMYGFCNPKSSTGRLDMHVRVLADGVPRYDSVTPRGYAGELWAAVHPKSFGVQIHEGTPLTQLMLFTGNSHLSESEFEQALKQYELVYHETEDRPLEYDELVTHDKDGSLVLTAMIGNGACGYVCVADKEQVVDVANVEGYNNADFFAPIYAKDGVLKLERNKFYILSGAERVRIPPHMACEMAPMDERSGDFRSHYAGFLDPGWGWGEDGEGLGRPFTLEVRPFEDVVVRAGQPVAKIKFETLTEEPDRHYDTKASVAGKHNYLKQSGPKLGKQFK